MKIDKDFQMFPDSGTAACLKYCQEQKSIWGFLGFVSHMALSIDKHSKIAAKALLDTISAHKTEEEAVLERVKYQQTLDTPHPAVLHLIDNEQLFLQTMLSRAVDNFLAYISEILYLIFKNKPDMLKSHESVKVETILEFKAIDDLLNSIAEKKVHELSYQGIRDLSKYLQDKFSLTLFEVEADLKKAATVIEFRNLITHNRAIVNNIFLKKTGLSSVDFELGSKLSFEQDIFAENLNFLHSSVKEIDARVARKFQLPVNEFNKANMR